MQATESLQQLYERTANEATRLAGGLNDLAQRAATYHHLFEHSGRGHIFPLIAAHGALWARGYFQFGLRLGRLLSWQYPLSSAKRKQQLAALADFADAFRDVNRRVCIDTYTSYHFTAECGEHPDADKFICPNLLEALNRLHHARRRGRQFNDRQRREVFTSHFLNEQETVVGPSIEAAVAALDWPLARAIALKPLIRFAYFPAGYRLWFRRFNCTEERIENGLRAFDWGAQAGWEHAEATLQSYRVLPAAFFTGSAEHFATLREAILS